MRGPRSVNPKPSARVVRLSAPGLRVCGVVKRFDQRVVVDGVDLTVHRGEVVALLGESGAGKTTLMHLAAGLLAPDEGEVVVDGERDPRRPRVRARLGYAPQATALYEDLDARENLALLASVHLLHRDDRDTRIAWALACAGLESRAGDPVRTYSGGMKRRLHVVSAALHDPPLLLLDEPTVGVDARARHDLLTLVGALRDEGRAIVYATHHLDEARRVADRVAVLDRGRIIAIDAAERLARGHDGDLEAAYLSLTAAARGDT